MNKFFAFIFGCCIAHSAWAQQVPNPLSSDAINAKLPWSLAGNQTTGSTTEGFQVQFKNQTSTDADALYIWRCTVTLCTDPSFVGNFDHNRIITVVPPGSTTDLQTSQSIYFINKSGRSGPPYAAFPVYVGQNITGICDADGAGCWAGNSIITDNRGQGAVAAKPLRFLVGWEADFQANSTGTWVSGFLTGGSSSVQPANANGYSCLWLDGQVHQGSVAKWGSCLTSQDGSSYIFANIGSRDVAGANVPSQIVDFHYRDFSNVAQHMSLAATAGGLLVSSSGAASSGSVVIGDGAAFATGDNGGLRINARTATVGSAGLLSFGPDAGWTDVNVGNTTAALTLFGVSFKLTTLPSSAGVGGLAVCVDNLGVLYKKASCP